MRGASKTWLHMNRHRQREGDFYNYFLCVHFLNSNLIYVLRFVEFIYI